MTLFKRSYKILVGDLDVSNLRCGFTVEKHLRKEPNTAKISIWNLSQEHRKQLEGRDKIPVQIEAGYEDARPLLFVGILDTALSERSRADWITNVYTHDGKAALTARQQVSYRAGVSVQKVVKDLADSLGVGLGNLTEILSSAGTNIKGVGTSLPRGFRSRGAAYESLDRVLGDSGIEVSIQDGQIQARVRGRAAPGESALLRRDTGLIGTPAVDRKGRLEAMSLIIPGLNPGSAVRVESTTANGEWLIDSTEYTGDTFSGDWYANIEGRPLG